MLDGVKEVVRKIKFILIAATKAVDFGKYVSFWKSSKQHTFYLVLILKQMGIKTLDTNMQAKEDFFQISDNRHIGSANQALPARSYLKPQKKL